jgi:hypothetical protein
MAGPLFSYTNYADTGVYTAGDQVSTLPVSNLADRRVQKVWRSGTSYATWFGIDFGDSVGIGILGLFGCTLFSTDTVRHRLSNVALGNGEILDTGAVASGISDGYDQTLKVLGSGGTNTTARYWRCDINAISRSFVEGYFDIGRAWAGPVWQPSVGISLNWSEAWDDTSQIERSPVSGATFVQGGVSPRGMSVQFDYLSEDDKANALYIDRTVGTRGQLLFVPDETSTTLNAQAILGRQTRIARISQPTDTYPVVYSKAYDLQQDL